MNTINKQLNIGVIPPNTNIIPSRYARASRQYQVQLGTEDPSLDFYNDSRGLDSMSNANGWEDCKDLETMADVEEYNEYAGLGVAYPACLKGDCKICKTECKSSKGLRWGKGGKECYKTCRARLKTEANNQLDSLIVPSATGESGVDQPVDNRGQESKGMSTGAKVGLAVGGFAILGLALYLVMRKK